MKIENAINSASVAARRGAEQKDLIWFVVSAAPGILK
jgi:hypothetical protein